MRFPTYAFKHYAVHIMHVGRGHLRPAVTIWHFYQPVQHARNYPHPTKTSVQRLLRLLKAAGGECTPGYPVSDWEITFYYNFKERRYVPRAGL